MMKKYKNEQTINTFIRKTARRQNISRSTKKIYFAEAKSIPEKYIESRSIRKYEKYLLKKGYAKKTISRKCSILRLVYEASRLEYFDKKIYTAKKNEKLRQQFGEIELKDILKISPEPEKSLYTLLLITGLRISELLSGNVSRETFTTTLKGGKKKKFFIPFEMKKYFSNILQIRKPYRRIAKDFRRTCRKAGSMGKSLHSLRHNFASYCYWRFGEDTTRKALNHNSREVFQVYIHEKMQMPTEYATLAYLWIKLNR